MRGELVLNDATAALVDDAAVPGVADGLHAVESEPTLRDGSLSPFSRTNCVLAKWKPRLDVSVADGRIVAVRSFIGSHFDFGRTAVRRMSGRHVASTGLHACGHTCRLTQMSAKCVDLL